MDATLEPGRGRPHDPGAEVDPQEDDGGAPSAAPAEGAKPKPAPIDPPRPVRDDLGVAVRLGGEATSCALCHAAIHLRRTGLVCPGCGTAVHQDCIRGGTCPTLGCSRRAAEFAPLGAGAARSSRRGPPTAWVGLAAVLAVVASLTVVGLASKVWWSQGRAPAAPPAPPAPRADAAVAAPALRYAAADVDTLRAWLDEPRIAVADRAALELVARGPTMIPHLLAHLESGAPRGRRQAAACLDTLLPQAGALAPEVEAALLAYWLDVVRRIDAGEATDLTLVEQALARREAPAVRSLLELLDQLQTDEARAAAVHALDGVLERRGPQVDDDTLDALVEVALAHPDLPVRRDLARALAQEGRAVLLVARGLGAEDAAHRAAAAEALVHVDARYGAVAAVVEPLAGALEPGGEPEARVRSLAARALEVLAPETAGALRGRVRGALAGAVADDPSPDVRADAFAALRAVDPRAAEELGGSRTTAVPHWESNCVVPIEPRGAQPPGR